MKYPIGTKVIIGGWALPDRIEDSIVRGEVVGYHGRHRFIHLTQAPTWWSGKYSDDTMTDLLPDCEEVVAIIEASHTSFKRMEEVKQKLTDEAKAVKKERDEKLATWRESHKAPRGK